MGKSNWTNKKGNEKPKKNQSIQTPDLQIQRKIQQLYQALYTLHTPNHFLIGGLQNPWATEIDYGSQNDIQGSLIDGLDT